MPKAVKKPKSPSPVDSAEDQIEIIDTPSKPPTRNSKPGIPASRPVPKNSTKRLKVETDFRGSPVSRIKNPILDPERISTRSTSGIKKKRIIPDNDEDYCIQSDQVSKRVRIDESDIDERETELKPFTGAEHSAQSSNRSLGFSKRQSTYETPTKKGKSKAEVPEDADEATHISDDWVEEEIEIALKQSRKGHVGVGESSKMGSEKESATEDPFIISGTKNAMPDILGKPKKKYLEDYENFVVESLPDEDESFFPDVQDPLLRRQYRSLPPLRIGLLLSWSTSGADIPHIPYSEWPKIIPDMDIEKTSSIMRMIMFERKGRYFNPCRLSPLEVTTRESYRGRHEVFINKQPAVAIITGYCTESNLFPALGTRHHKSIVVLFHGQEWERYCCFTNMIFDHEQMTAQLYQSALTFSTLPDSISAPPIFRSANVSPLSGRRAKTNDTPVERARGALYFTDTVPVYDARKIAYDSSVDFENLKDTFPLFTEEIPPGSCIAVGHSITSYRGKKGNNTEINLGTNILFVILFGVPS